MQAFARRTSGRVRARGTARVPLSKRFTRRYAVVLGVVVLLAVGGKLAIDDTGAQIRDATRQLDEATGQAALVTDISELAVTIAQPAVEPGSTDGAADTTTTANTASTLKQKALRLRQVQLGLVEGDATLDLPKVPLTPELDAVYNEPTRLAQSVNDISSAGTNLADLADTPANQGARQDAAQLISSRVPEVQRGQQRAIQLYADQIAAGVSKQKTDSQLLVMITLVAVAAMLFGLFRPLARSIHLETSQLEDAERMARENNERQTFRNDLSQALETTDSESEVIAAVGRAFLAIVPDHKAELLLADASGTHLRRAQINPARGAAGCPVDAPLGCAAIRRGQTVVYESSRMLNVCPKLPEHEHGVCSAVCTPVMFMGSALGVLHATGVDGHPPNIVENERLAVLAAEAGNRLGILRTTRATELQATTDGLTGLLNRRAIEAKARSLLLEQQPFALALADLDHFKRLNDTHGHEAGDRALRLFASVVKSSLRPVDVCARFGGEEFVVLLPEATTDEAIRALDRLQIALADQIAATSSIAFTASWGLTDHLAGETFDEIVHVADGALYAAKRGGRNRIVTASTPPPAPAATPPSTPPPAPPPGPGPAPMPVGESGLSTL